MVGQGRLSEELILRLRPKNDKTELDRRPGSALWAEKNKGKILRGEERGRFLNRGGMWIP